MMIPYIKFESIITSKNKNCVTLSTGICYYGNYHFV